ncbi:MAG: ATP-binding cassette domain-containing protein [Geminicoccaceae bacterium]
MTGYGGLPLRFEAVSFERARQKLIDNLDLEIRTGPPTFILGPNGAGKSLTLRLAHGLLEPTAGRVTWRDHPQPAQAMVFQRPVMLRRSAIANIRFALAVHHVPRDRWNERCEMVLDRTGLNDLAHRPARRLSVGEQQRLALARVWALEPAVLFLDEPTASLDPAATRRVEAIVQAIAEGGTKIIMTSHDLGQAKRLAGEILFLHKGRLLERTPAERFFNVPDSAEAQAFLKGELLW